MRNWKSELHECCCANHAEPGERCPYCWVHSPRSRFRNWRAIAMAALLAALVICAVRGCIGAIVIGYDRGPGVGNTCELRSHPVGKAPGHQYILAENDGPDCYEDECDWVQRGTFEGAGLLACPLMLIVMLFGAAVSSVVRHRRSGFQ